MKKQIDTIDATPSKRTFLPIIADYDLNKSICELIDNVLDAWVKSGKTKDVTIDISFEINQQNIRVTDNAGGIDQSELSFVVGPGQTGNEQTDETIGIFGVGTKMAVVALSQDIKITSRRKGKKAYLVELNDGWLAIDSWELPYYEVDDIKEGTTVIELQKLRFLINENAICDLKGHLQATYAKYLQNNRIKIVVDGDTIKPVFFENWAYPPNFQPREYVGNLKTNDQGTIKVQVLAGLSKESSPALGEYGVYFYCNDRLIARGLKTHDVGFTKGLVGPTHPSISLTRVIVSLNGQTQAMPWNSSKSGINPNHSVFVTLRDWLIRVTKEYASLSRRWQGDWPDKVFKYTSGKIVTVPIDDFKKTKKSYLPALPASKPRYPDLIKQANKEVAKEKPWTRGLYESIAAVDLIYKKKLDEKNRICLIILDSALEIGFKEYLVNDSKQPYSGGQLHTLFQKRESVHEEIKKYITLKDNTWQKIKHYYDLRCKLVHERATAGITDPQIEDFREVVQDVLTKLFNLTFKR